MQLLHKSAGGEDSAAAGGGGPVRGGSVRNRLGISGLSGVSTNSPTSDQ